MLYYTLTSRWFLNRSDLRVIYIQITYSIYIRDNILLIGENMRELSQPTNT